MNTVLCPKEGWEINPNANIVRGILNSLERTGGICPCDNDSEDKTCPCSNYREHDKCCCGLYVKIMEKTIQEFLDFFKELFTVSYEAGDSEEMKSVSEAIKDYIPEAIRKANEITEAAKETECDPELLKQFDRTKKALRAAKRIIHVTSGIDSFEDIK